MLVFWWQGKGFFALLIAVASVILTGLGADALDQPSYTPGFWAVALACAAPVNWIVGRRLNAKRRKTFGFLPWHKQLIYRARHKFLSLPMETFSVAMLVIAAGLTVETAMRG